MQRWKSDCRFGVACLAVFTMALALALMGAPVPRPASADTAPVRPTDPKTPVTVAADRLPTTQIDGVAWTQLVIGNTVYVGGSFATARPAGAAPGVSTTPRSNLLAYDITTGRLITTWAPATNGEVLSMAASPDHSVIYVGGSFTAVTVRGVRTVRSRIAALNASTGAVLPGFAPKPDANVRALATSGTSVYLGGLFKSVGGVARGQLAAVRASDGALLNWVPSAFGGRVSAIAISPDGKKALVGGQFTSLNGGSNPGYGLGAVGAVAAGSNGRTNLAWPANATVRNGGLDSGINSLTTDGASVYATGFVFGSGGTLEGIARMSWSDGSIIWVEDCHGDTYGTFPGLGDVIYAVSHAHYCGNLADGFPQTTPWTSHWATAFSKSVTAKLAADQLHYADWNQTPSPALQKWFPLLGVGAVTGQNQAGWSVTGNSSYLAVGGEFPTAGGVAQQGLVRYARKDIAPNLVGPVAFGARFNPTVRSFTSGEIRLGWRANWDRDNESLTYTVWRNSVPIAASTQTQSSSEWSRPMMGYTDSGRVPGRTYSYRLTATDPWGNVAKSETVPGTAGTGPALSAYAKAVYADGATSYWRAGGAGPGVLTDWAGPMDAVAKAGVTHGAAGAIRGDPDRATTFSGTSTGFAATPPASTALGLPPNTFSMEVWIKTRTTRGGKIIGYGDAATGNSTVADRHVYLTNRGKLVFGVNTGTGRTAVSTRSYNDGGWHHVIATLGADGMKLYVDGALVGQRREVTRGQSYIGGWRIGGDTLTGWPSAPTSRYLAGVLDEIAIYPRVLSAAQVRRHFLNGSAPAPAVAMPEREVSPPGR